MNERDYWTVEAMEKFGGSFVKQLAMLARMADSINLQKIKSVWVEYWAQYQKMGEDLEKKSDGTA